MSEGLATDTGTAVSGGAARTARSALRVRDLTFDYPPSRKGTSLLGRVRARRDDAERADRPHVLQDIDLGVGRGEFVALVGPSGGGKTTLLHLFTGLLQAAPGTVAVNDHPPRMGSEDTSYMFARDALLPWRDALHNVMLGMERDGLGRTEIQQRATDALRSVELDHLAGSHPNELSQGQRQRVAL